MQESGNPYFCMDFLNLQYSILEPGSTVRPATRMSKMKTKSKNANAKIVSTISIFIYKPVLSQIYSIVDIGKLKILLFSWRGWGDTIV